MTDDDRRPDGDGTVTKEAPSQQEPTDGIYTGEGIPAGVEDQLDNEPPGDGDRDGYARVLGIDREREVIDVTVELFDGSVETLRFDAPSDARLQGRLRDLFYYLDLEDHGSDGVYGELLPVKRTSDGVVLGDLGLESPESNRRGGEPPSRPLPGIAGQVQPYDSALGFLESLLASSVTLLLLIPLFVAGVVQLFGGDIGAVVPVVAAQFCIATVLVIRSSILDPN